MGREHLQKSDVNRGHEPGAVRSPAFRRQGAKMEGRMKTFNSCSIACVPPAEAGTPNPARLARLRVRDSARHEVWSPAFRRFGCVGRLKAGLQTGRFMERKENPHCNTSFTVWWPETSDRLSIRSVPNAKLALLSSCHDHPAIRRDRGGINVVGRAVERADVLSVIADRFHLGVT